MERPIFLYGKRTTGGTSSLTRFFSTCRREGLAGSRAGASIPGTNGYQL